MSISHKVSDHYKLPWWLPTDFNGSEEAGVDSNQTKFSGKELYNSLCHEFLSHSQKQQEDSVMIFASNQET